MAVDGELKPRILAYNRATRRLEPEIILGERFVVLLYGNAIGRLLGDAIFKRRAFSRLFGWLQDRRLSARKIPRVAARLGIDLAELEKPLAAYATFNEFFSRGLAAGARPIDAAPDAVVSPCDARLLALPSAGPDGAPIRVKGSAFTLPRLLADPDLAARYAGGTALVYRLCPADYHRFHFPEACVPGEPVRIGGPLHSVNPIALATGRRILDANLRERTLLAAGPAAGTIAMVEVGALCVGSIRQTFEPGVPVKRGEEKGMFRFGGSTVIVLYEPGRVRIDEDILIQSGRGLETLVRVGMRVGTYVRPSADVDFPPPGSDDRANERAS